MPGAAVLAARAALASGAGLVTLAMPRSLSKIITHRLVEAMQLALPETSEGSIASTAYSRITDFIQKRRVSSVLIGPGLSQNPQTAALVRRLVASINAPLVLDADGLNACRGAPLGRPPSTLRHHAAPLVVTPHKREFERLFAETWPENETARIRLAKKLSKLYDGVLILKGHRTLVVKGDRCLHVNTSGNPGMAKGGSGDVLAGMITAFIAQGLSDFEAARWAVYTHGLAGDLAVKKTGELGLLASNLIDHLPQAFKKASLE